ncbi:hypothetical protein [Streptomyces griseocarneus]|uniref:hypothetical protein n=1 Tax=Streptomyces griseocarneus TaxID=51201 RepID=UPI0019C32A35|nr:hypothetical protein [Streptomyces griseocarneus]MBZ6476613.1 hypothetical protein [Streptomyces griseocarneus]GHG79432.1 hypothetical protein GCM10018779_60140 [Streptomyces griseocarneus]
MIPTIPSSTSPTSFSGDFEAHLTVRADDPAGVAALEAYAAARGVKFTHIVLERGRTPSQPMLTLRGRGGLDGMRGTVEEAAHGLREAGFGVVRTKIESTPWAEGVPGTDEEAVVLGGRYYFEHHLKLLLAPGADTVALADVVSRHAAHLSRNARRVRADGRAERFVTQRCRLVGDRTARARLEGLVAALQARGDEIVSVEREFVVHDSDESLDAGWIDEEGTGR